MQRPRDLGLIPVANLKKVRQPEQVVDSSKLLLSTMKTCFHPACLTPKLLDDDRYGVEPRQIVG